VLKLCRFTREDPAVKIGLVHDSTVVDLTPAGVTTLASVLEDDNPVARLEEAARQALPTIALSQVQLRPPIERQEVWAAGVTYLRSKRARVEESDFCAMAYDRVYDAERPEIFFKALPEKVVGHGEPVGIRQDATWNVPEPELALVISARGRIVGYTVGNDMSSRDIEGENLLYLPQAKIYSRSCALGPWIVIGEDEEQARSWSVRVTIARAGAVAFQGDTSVGSIRRGFSDLVSFLWRSQLFPYGAVLLTGTGIVPPDSFTLKEHDAIDIEISGIGTLTNAVAIV
jgi:2-dehydro-3-deoxy-D-arabinonate dehydratase